MCMKIGNRRESACYIITIQYSLILGALEKQEKLNSIKFIHSPVLARLNNSLLLTCLLERNFSQQVHVDHNFAILLSIRYFITKVS